VRDVTAGASAGCEPHLVLTGKSSAFLAGGQPEGLPAGTRLHRDLSAFADFLLERSTLGGFEPPAAHPAT
jgi:D-glycero-D-manno-heptose 1,7-bisphosphate phosphatase